MAKTIKQIADEIGVTKQAVYKRFKGKLNVACAPYVHTVDGTLYLEAAGEQIIKNDFEHTCRSNAPLECSIGAAGVDVTKMPETLRITGDLDASDESFVPEKNKLERSDSKSERSNGTPVIALENDYHKAEYAAEIEFLHRQIERLQDELEKERAHNREKDRQLLDTLAKLSETQAALAIGQSADKQKALAETLIEGKKIESSEDENVRFVDVEDSFEKQKKKRGFWGWIWSGITGKQ